MTVLVQLLQAVQAMHDPVVFFDKDGVDGALLTNDADQIGKFFVLVKKFIWHETLRPGSAMAQRTSWLLNHRTRERLFSGPYDRHSVPASSPPPASRVCARPDDQGCPPDRPAGTPWRALREMRLHPKIKRAFAKIETAMALVVVNDGLVVELR